MLIAIAAMTLDRIIGKNNTLPRHLPEDLKRFKELTTEKTVIMGRKTYESLPPSVCPLPNRHNIILSGHNIYTTDKTNCTVETLKTKEDVLSRHKKNNQQDVFIIGGSQIYNLFLHDCDQLYITEIQGTYDGDTYFPEFKDSFIEISREHHDSHDFVIYEKKTSYGWQHNTIERSRVHIQ